MNLHRHLIVVLLLLFKRYLCGLSITAYTVCWIQCPSYEGTGILFILLCLVVLLSRELMT